MSGPETGRPEAVQPGLASWLAFLGSAECTCRYEWRKDLGRLYGQSIGPGWVLVDTDPACTYHRP